MHKSVHKSSVPYSYILLFIVKFKSYLNVSVFMSYIYIYIYIYTDVLYACMYQELHKKPQQIPCVFAHIWRIKLILILMS